MSVRSFPSEKGLSPHNSSSSLSLRLIQVKTVKFGVDIGAWRLRVAQESLKY